MELFANPISSALPPIPANCTRCGADIVRDGQIVAACQDVAFRPMREFIAEGNKDGYFEASNWQIIHTDCITPAEEEEEAWMEAYLAEHGYAARLARGEI